MAIRVAKGVADRIIEYPGSISLQVQGASDPEAAAAGLRSALEEIETLGSNSFSEGGDALTPNSVGGVVTVPGGPFITSINAPMVPEWELAKIPDIVARHLREAGVRTAVIALPPQTGPLDGLEHTPRAVMLRLYPPRLVDSLQAPPRPVGWLDEAWAWLAGHVQDDVVNALVSSTQFPLLAADVPTFAERYRQRGSVVLMSGDLRSRAWGVHLTASVVLGFGGPEATDAELVAMVETFEDIALRLAPEVAQAFVDIAERFGPFSTFHHGTRWYGSGGEDPVAVEYVCHQLCFEGFPFQVLGPGHVARLTAASPERTLPPRFRPLAGGRAELAVGEPAAWLPDSPERSAVLEEARALLAPCLLRRGESRTLREERRAKAQQATASGEHEPPTQKNGSGQ